MTFRSTDICMVWSFYSRAGMSLYLLMSTFASCRPVFKVSLYPGFCTFLTRLISKHFTFFNTVVYGVVFAVMCMWRRLVSLLILYAAACLRLFLPELIWAFSQVSRAYPVISSANRFTFCFSALVALPDFSCLIAPVPTSRTIMNGSGGSRRPCLVLILVDMPLVVLHLVDAGFGTTVSIFLSC